jgi:hypothetical protein
MSESFRIGKVQWMKLLGENSCVCVSVYSYCWLQDQLASGIGWQQQQQQPLYNLDQQTQQWPVQQEIDGTGGDGELSLLESGQRSRGSQTLSL